MKRLVIPLVLGLVIGLMASSASGQTILTDESIGFLKIVRQLPDSTVAIPIFIQNDSMVTGVIFLFEFDHNILEPVIAFNSGYQKLLDSAAIDPTYTPPDSVDYKVTAASEPGLWDLELVVSDEIKDYGWVNPIGYSPPSHPNWGAISMTYNLNKRDSVKLLMTPGIIDSVYAANTPGFVIAHIPGGLVYAPDTLGVNIGYVMFKVASTASIHDQSPLHTTRNIPNQVIATELAEEWYDPAAIKPRQTVAVFPQNLLSSVFVVDTPVVDTVIEPDENILPVLSTISPNIYNIMAGETVSFNVTASDAEAGVVTIRLDDGNPTTANAIFGLNGTITGAGGVATGTFSFKPGLDQVGNFSFKFEATDDSGAVSGPQFVSVYVEGIDEDVLFTTSSDDFFPEGGVPGLDGVMVPINVISEKTIYGIQFDITYDETYFKLDSIVKSDRIPNWIIYDNPIDGQPGTRRIVAFGLANDSMISGATSAVLYLSFSVDPFATPGCYDLGISNAWESIDPDPNTPSLEMIVDSGILCVDLLGDVNLDRRINVADLVSVVAYIIDNYDLNRRQFAAGDVIINDSVNVVDLVGIINIVFGLPISPIFAPPVPIGEYATVEIIHDDIAREGIQSVMSIEAEMPIDVAGVELEIAYNPNTVEMLKPLLTDASHDFQIYSKDNGTGKMTVLIHSEHPWNDDELIGQGLSDIIKLPFVSKAPIRGDDDYQVQITRAAMSTGAAKEIPVKGINPDPPLPNMFELYQNRPNPFNPTTYIEFYIDGSFNGGDNVKLDVLNILGQTVKTLINKQLSPGMHTVIWDGNNNDGELSATGVYLYRLQVGNESKTKKMVLLK